jgi:hypothetical protein
MVLILITKFYISTYFSLALGSHLIIGIPPRRNSTYRPPGGFLLMNFFYFLFFLGINIWWPPNSLPSSKKESIGQPPHGFLKITKAYSFVVVGD